VNWSKITFSDEWY